MRQYKGNYINEAITLEEYLVKLQFVKSEKNDEKKDSKNQKEDPQNKRVMRA